MATITLTVPDTLVNALRSEAEIWGLPLEDYILLFLDGLAGESPADPDDWSRHEALKHSLKFARGYKLRADEVADRPFPSGSLPYGASTVEEYLNMVRGNIAALYAGSTLPPDFSRADINEDCT